MVWGQFKRLFFTVLIKLAMIHFPLTYFKVLQHKRSKLQSSFVLYALSVPVHFHFGFYAQTTSKDFVK